MNRKEEVKAELFNLLHPEIRVSMDGLGGVTLRSHNEDILEVICANLYIPDLIVTEISYKRYKLSIHPHDIDELLGE